MPGEIAAQALYHGQALTARDPKVRQSLLDAARDETDHLAWCEDRVRELDSHTSLLSPFWYAGAFTIGAMTGLAGDRTSLGFVAETEKQVVEHLESHLHELPEDDERSRRIVAQMQADEDRHGSDARKAGAPGTASTHPRTDAPHRADHDPDCLSDSKNLRHDEYLRLNPQNF